MLEGTRAKLRTAQAFQLEAQSAVAAMNCLALRLSATFVRLGSDPPSPSGVVSSSSLEEAVKLLEDLVSRIEAFVGTKHRFGSEFLISFALPQTMANWGYI